MSVMENKHTESEPKPVPIYIIPFYHFESTTKPSQLLDTLNQTINRVMGNNAICISDAKKFRIKCCVYLLGESVIKFFCNIFTKQKDLYIVEFNLRKGD